MNRCATSFAAALVVAALAAWLGLVAPVLAADAVWTGAWDTQWPDGSARMVLQQHGTAVEGSYPLYDGHITGTAVGDRLEGEWTEGSLHGRFVFVLGPVRQAFSGRFGDGAWWTGVRTGTQERLPESRDATPPQALRSFVLAGNYAAAGYADAMANAVHLVTFGPGDAALDVRGKLARAKAMFDAVSLTTFHTDALADPAPGEKSVSYDLPQAGTDVVLRVTLVQVSDGAWRITVPTEDALAGTYHALLARDGGRPAPPNAVLALRSPRDTMRSFVDAMLHWDSGGSQRVLDTMDLSEIRAGQRDDQGRLDAQYMIRVINRVGAWQWQAIPDDPASRTPYVFFSHGAGRIVIAPQGDGNQTKWRFTADTVDSQFRLFIVTEGMPPVWGMQVLVPPSGLFAFRERLATIWPMLLARSVYVGFENWQIIAFFAMLAAAAVAALLIVPLLIRVLEMALRLLGSPLDPELGRRLTWPLRLIAFVLIWFRFRWRVGLTGAGLTVLDSVAGVLAAIGVAWAGLPLVDALASGFYSRAKRTAGSMDDILVSLTAGLLKLTLIITVAIVAAQAVDLPISGMLASLGIGGLAVAFASKEALSNLFGAGILLADRPFRNGDTISVGEVQGTVEHVGIRSTRIRTVDDTVVVLPNGKLSDALINNYGARRHRLFRTTLHVAYGATPEQLDTFTRRLREAVDAHPSTAEERTQVGLWQLSDGGIDLDLVCYFRAETAGDERGARHDLLLEVMRLAEAAGVRFTNAPVV